VPGDSPTPNGDPYATAKANLRDTVKWLGGIFGALAAAVVAGAPLSGLGSFDADDHQMWFAAALLLVAFICICIALSVTLGVLREDFLYSSDIDPGQQIGPHHDGKEIEAIRSDIAKHAKDLYPDYATYAGLLTQTTAAQTNATALWNAWIADQGDPNLSKDDVAESKAAYDTQYAELQKLVNLQSDILHYGAYIRFYRRLQRAQPKLFGLGIVALICLTVFAVASHKKEDPKGPQTIVLPVMVAASAPAPTSLTSTKLGEVRFATGKWNVQPDGLMQINHARNVAAAQPDTVVMLMAHTDTVGGKVNQKLAMERAEAVRTLLTGPGGLAAARVYSAELPKAALPNVTADQVGDDANRTVVMYLVPMKQ
jgi:outer membrane protein OmpA-like peptidoglycan-associated protein